jgi:hypothetical protein
MKTENLEKIDIREVAYCKGHDAELPVSEFTPSILKNYKVARCKECMKSKRGSQRGNGVKALVKAGPQQMTPQDFEAVIGRIGHMNNEGVAFVNKVLDRAHARDMFILEKVLGR